MSTSPHILLVEASGPAELTVTVTCPHGAYPEDIPEPAPGQTCLYPTHVYTDEGPMGPWYCQLASMLDDDAWLDQAESIKAGGGLGTDLLDAMWQAAEVPDDYDGMLPAGRYEVDEFGMDGDVDDDGRPYSYWYAAGVRLAVPAITA